MVGWIQAGNIMVEQLMAVGSWEEQQGEIHPSKALTQGPPPPPGPFIPPTEY